MALVVPDVSGEILMLHYIVGLATAGHPVLHLYRNDLTPSDSTVIASFSEVTSAGYTVQTLTSSLWTTTQAAGTTTAVFSEKTFNFSTDAVVYGYYVTTTSNALLWCERFSGAPFSIPDGGGSISISSRITLS